MNRRMMWLTTLAILVPSAIALACPMCKDSIGSSDAPQAASLPGGFNDSIYYMLGGFLATASFVITIIARGIRSANSTHEKSR